MGEQKVRSWKITAKELWTTKWDNSLTESRKQATISTTCSPKVLSESFEDFFFLDGECLLDFIIAAEKENSVQTHHFHRANDVILLYHHQNLLWCPLDYAYPHPAHLLPFCSCPWLSSFLAPTTQHCLPFVFCFPKSSPEVDASLTCSISSWSELPREAVKVRKDYSSIS